MFAVTYYDGVCAPMVRVLSTEAVYAIVERRQHAVLHTQQDEHGTWVVLDYLGEIAVCFRP